MDGGCGGRSEGVGVRGLSVLGVVVAFLWWRNEAGRSLRWLKERYRDSEGLRL